MTTRKKITLHGSGGRSSDVFVDAWEYGLLFVHSAVGRDSRFAGPYTITHEPTGFRVATGFPTLACAQTAARQMLDVGSWDFTCSRGEGPKFFTDEQRKRIKVIAKEFGGALNAGGLRPMA